jgi:SanA protein
MPPTSVFQQPWLRWPLALAIAVVLAIALLIDYSISTLRGFLLNLGIGSLLVLCVFAIPQLRSLRPFLRALILCLPIAVLWVTIHANISATYASRGLIYSEISQLPPTRVGLVFGTTDRIQGRENLYFRYRIDAATEVWNAGKIDTLIVSGDNRSRYYNEPEKMRRALIRRGIPADRIVCDYAGLRTFDSVVRAKEIFGTDSVLLISQRFQNERAIYIAKANGIHAYGYAARDVNTQAGLKTKLREVGARVKMWLDVHFLNTRPKYLGDREPLPE